MTDQSPFEKIKFDEITGCIKDLNSLGPDTESEFLFIGNALNTLATICYTMTDNAVKLSALSNFNREQEVSVQDSFVEENTQIFDAVTHHVKTTLTTLSKGEHLLSELYSQVISLHEPIQKLQSISKTFRVLGVAFKVESSKSHTDMKGFALLADEVAEIAVSVHDNCRYCIDKTNLVEIGIATSQKFLNDVSQSYDESGDQAICKILQTLDGIGSKSDQLAAVIQERSTAMVCGISDVVMAMQFHDITRQQLENVASALGETLNKAQLILSQGTTTESEQIVLEIYSILSIQVAHLNSIYEQVYSARKSIEDGLVKVMAQAKIQATDARILLELEGQEGTSSVVDDLGKEIEKIVESLNKTLEAVKGAADVSRQVNSNVSEISVFVNEIDSISFDVKILAINAMVAAIKTDTVASTLIILAKELSNLSQETRDNTTCSTSILEGIILGTEKQLEFCDNLDQSNFVVDELIGRAKNFTKDILLKMQQISNIGEAMDVSSNNLANRVLALVSGMKFPKILGDRIDKNWQIICRILGQIEEAYPQFLEKGSEVTQMLEKLAEQYVMERERSIHAQVAGSAGNAASFEDSIDMFEDSGFELFDDEPVSTQEDALGRVKKEDFGDNIELF